MLTFLLTIMLCVTVMADTAGIVAVENTAAVPGETVTVNLTIQNNPGIAALSLKVTYGSELTLISVKDTGIMGEKTHGGTLQSPYGLTWNNMANRDSDGTIAVLNFQVSEDAAAGTEIPVSVEIVDDVYDIDETIYDFTSVNGSITVTAGDVHTFTGADAHVFAKAPACEEDGNIEYWVCDKCGKYFADAEGETEITEADTVIKATGHKMGEWNITKQPTADADGSAERLCVNGCGLKETKTVARVQIPVSDESDGDSKQVSVNVIEGDGDEDVHVSINQEELDVKLEELGVTGDSTGDTASGVITIDVAAAADAVDSIDAINQVTIPKKSVDNVAEAANNSENNTTSLEVKLSSGTVQFDAVALDKISSAAGDQNAEGVKMVVNTVETESETAADKAAEITDKLEMNEAETAALQDVADNVSDNNGEILSAVEIAVVPVVGNEAKKEDEIHDLGGEVTVTINVDLDGYDIYGITIHHISPNGATEEITAKNFVYDNTAKTLTFTVDSFSAFVLTYVKPESYILGDVDGDNNITTSDASAILRYIVGYVDTGVNVLYGDVDGDNNITTSDASGILRYIVGYEDNPNIGKRIEG